MRTPYQIFYLDNEIKWEAKITANSKEDAAAILLKVYPKAEIVRVLELRPEPKPLFTTKHYKAIEKILKEINHESMTFWEVAGKFRELFVNDNPKFDEAKFAQKISKIGSRK